VVMNCPPFPVSESSLGLKAPPFYRAKSLPEVKPLGRRHLQITPGKWVAGARMSGAPLVAA
jgi:hypothetical protein